VHLPDQLAEEVHERRFPECDHLRGALGRHRLAVRRLEAAAAGLAPARPALALGADVRRPDPRGLVPEHPVGARCERRVRPLAAEGAVALVVEASRGDPPAVVEHLARLGMEPDEAALGLAAERPPHAPRAELHLQPRLV
jgi:hypothetical protein